MSKENIGEPLIETWRFTSRFDKWDWIKDDIIKIEQTCFQEFADTPEELEDELTDERNVVLLLRDALGDKTIGYTLATPQSKDTAYVASTAILPEFQDRGYLPMLINRLERELQARGFKYMERHAEVSNGYADNIEKHYGNRIVAKKDRHQRFFRIDIRPYWERNK